MLESGGKRLGVHADFALVHQRALSLGCTNSIGSSSVGCGAPSVLLRWSSIAANVVDLPLRWRRHQHQTVAESAIVLSTGAKRQFVERENRVPMTLGPFPDVRAGRTVRRNRPREPSMASAASTSWDCSSVFDWILRAWPRHEGAEDLGIRKGAS